MHPRPRASTVDDYPVPEPGVGGRGGEKSVVREGEEEEEEEEEEERGEEGVGVGAEGP